MACLARPHTRGGFRFQRWQAGVLCRDSTSLDRQSVAHIGIEQLDRMQQEAELAIVWSRA